MSALLLALAVNVAAKDGYKPAKVYMFGFATSLNDSTVYFTSIQSVDAYVEDNRTHFLYERDQYAYQLRNYLQTQSKIPHPTCVAVYALDEKTAMKKYLKIQGRYTIKLKGQFLVNSITDDEFRFHTVAPYEETDDGVAAEPHTVAKEPEQKGDTSSESVQAHGN